MADARDANILAAQTEAVIKSTGEAAGVSADHVADYASALSAASGASLFGDDQIQQSTNLLLTFTNIKDTTLDAATAISVDMAQALGGAPKDSAIQLGKALNDPIAGVGALTRVGVTFTEQQKEQIKVLQESGDMAGAQSIILAELNKEFGGSAAAAAKADGGMAQLKDQIGELAEGIGGALLPIVSQFVGFIATNVMPVVTELADQFAANLPSAIDYVTGTVIPNLISAWNTIAPTVQIVVSIVQDVIASFGAGGEASNELSSKVNDLASVWAALQPVIVNVANVVGEVIQAVFGVVQEFLRAHGADIHATMQDAWTRIMAIIKLGIELYNEIVPPVLKFIANFINAHGKEIHAILTNTWNSIKAVVDIALTLIEGVIKTALQLIQGDWSGAWETIKAMSARIVTDLWTIIKGGLDTIVVIFGGTWTKIKDGVGEFVTVTIPGLGRAIIDGLVTSVSNGASALGNAVWQMVKDAVANAISDLTGGGGSDPSTQGMSTQSRLSGPRAQSLGGAGGSVSTSSMRANVTINTQAAQNPHQVAKTTINQMNRQMKLRRA